MTSLFVWGLLGLGLSVALTALCKPLARRLGALAHPKTDRWHKQPVPVLGGVAILLAISIGLFLLPTVGRPVWVLLIAAASLAALGLFDDLFPVKPQVKFVGQILVASVLVAMDMQLRLTPYPLLNVLMTLTWIVGVTNAFNLLDNMDGLAAGIAAIAGAFRLAFFLRDGNMEGATVTALFIGALLGFLIYNFHPASIFMGDAGSLFIGVFVSGLSLIGGFPYSRGVLSVLLFPVLILLVPIFDTAFVMVTRMLSKRPIAIGGRDHTSHRLVAMGFSERQAVLALYLVAFTTGMVAYFSYKFGFSYTILITVFFAIGLCILGISLNRVRVYPEEEVALPDSGRFFRLMANFYYKRQVAKVLLDVFLIVLVYCVAYLIRFQDQMPVHEDRLLNSLPILIPCQLLSLAIFRAYQGTWRYTGIRELLRLAWAVTVGTAGCVLILVYLYRFAGYSRIVFALDWALLLASVVGSRFILHYLVEVFLPKQQFRPVLIYGATDGSELAVREIRENPAFGRTPVGFIDDHLQIRAQVHGLPVLGGLDQLEQIVRAHSIAEVVVASSKVSDQEVRRIAEACEPLNVSVVRASLRIE